MQSPSFESFEQVIFGPTSEHFNEKEILLQSLAEVPQDAKVAVQIYYILRHGGFGLPIDMRRATKVRNTICTQHTSSSDPLVAAFVFYYTPLLQNPRSAVSVESYETDRVFVHVAALRDPSLANNPVAACLLARLLLYFGLAERSGESARAKSPASLCDTLERVLQHSALELRWPDAQFLLAKYLARLRHGKLLAQGLTPDPALSKRILQLLAAASAQGHASARYFHGALVFEGVMGPADQALGIELMQDAAAKMHSGAIFDISCAYYNGTGVQRNPVLALRMLLTAVEHQPEHTHYMYGIGTLYGGMQRPDECLLWYRRGAEAGHTGCMFKLACELLERAGVDGEGRLIRTERKKKRIVRGKKPAATHRGGDSEQTELSPAERDYNEALHWLQRGADLGHPRCQNTYSSIMMSNLRDGFGVDTTIVHRLIGYLEHASKQGDASASFNLGLTYYWEYYGVFDLRKAFEWFCLASERGHVVATFNVGVCYEQGQGVEQDLVKAQFYYRRAAWMGEPNAAKNASNCFLYGTACPAHWSPNEQVGLMYLMLAEELGDRVVRGHNKYADPTLSYLFPVRL